MEKDRCPNCGRLVEVDELSNEMIHRSEAPVVVMRKITQQVVKMARTYKKNVNDMEEFHNLLKASEVLEDLYPELFTFKK